MNLRIVDEDKIPKSFAAARGLDLWLSVSTMTECLRQLAKAPKLRALKLSPKDLDLFARRYEVPEAIGGVRALEELVIEVNSAILLPSTIGKLVRLRTLRLGIRIDRLPSEIGDLAALEELTLVNEDPVRLPESIGKLKYLRVLSVRRVASGGLPSSLGDLAALEELAIWAPYNTTLPSTIGNLQRLRTLFFHGRSLPPSLVNCRSLEELRWNNFAISAKTLAALARLPALRVLHLSSTTSVDLGALGRALAEKPLEVLGVSFGHRDTVGPDFAKLTNLRRIEIGAFGAKEIKPHLPPGRWRKAVRNHEAIYERTR